MPLVRIRAKDRADHATTLKQCSITRLTSVIDCQPNLLGNGSGTIDHAQCASCNFLTFLDQVPSRPDSAQFVGLNPFREFFRVLPELVAAMNTGKETAARSVLQPLGVAASFEILAGAQGETPLPKIAVVRLDDPNDALTVLSKGSSSAELRAVRVVVELNRTGPQATLERIRRIRGLGFDNIALGFVEHASAMDHFSDFLDGHDFHEAWQRFVLEARAELPNLRLLLPIPGCAMLQWKPNRALEGTRAQLDLHFRRMSSDASLMCAENVSGYTLTNDIKSVLGASPAESFGYALRFANLLFTFSMPSHGPNALL